MPPRHTFDALSYLRSFLKLVTLGLFPSVIVQELGLGFSVPVPAGLLQPSHLHASERLRCRKRRLTLSPQALVGNQFLQHRHHHPHASDAKVRGSCPVPRHNLHPWPLPALWRKDGNVNKDSKEKKCANYNFFSFVDVFSLQKCRVSSLLLLILKDKLMKATVDLLHQIT